MKSYFDRLGVALGILTSLASISHAQGLSPEQLMQREVVRREEIIIRANRQLDEAERLVGEGKFDEAFRLIEESLSVIPQTGEGAPVHQRASTLFGLIAFQRARTLFAAKELLKAKVEADRAVESLSGENLKKARELASRINRSLGLASDGSGSLNPAFDQAFISNMNEANRLLKEARDLASTGQYDKAKGLLKQVRAIDPFNRAASQELIRIERKLREINEEAADVARRQRQMETTQEFLSQYRMRSAPADEPAVVPVTREAPARRRINDKLKELVIPEINFTNATIEQAAIFLTQATQAADRTGEGVSFIVTDAAKESANPITLRLRNVPLQDVLRYVTNLGGVKFRVQEFAVFIVPLSEPENVVLVTREFPVNVDKLLDVGNVGPGDGQPSRPGQGTASGGGLLGGGTTLGGVSAQASGTRTREAATGSITAALQARGVDFSAPGSGVTYNRATGMLVARNTQEQIDLIEAIVTDEADTLLVEIQMKLLEINQNDLEELVANYNMSIAQGQVAYGWNTALRGANGLSSNTIDALLGAKSAVDPSNQTPAPNSLGIRGLLDGKAFEILLNALSQKTGVSLMSAPSLVVENTREGRLDLVREFTYPTEFDEPELVTPDSGSDNNNRRSGFLAPTAVPAWPSQFETEDVGVSISVTPTVTLDRKRVLLQFEPIVREFDGFVNYGSPIRTNLGFGQPNPNLPVPLIAVLPNPVVLSDNIINQPVFSERTISRGEVEIQDGHTMVLGGLINETVDTIEEKVPLLGDLPLIGRAFRSKVERAIKKNLIIFVTVKILRPDGVPIKDLEN